MDAKFILGFAIGASAIASSLYAPAALSHKLTSDDKLELMELTSRFETTLDAEDVEGYLANFTEDGSLIAPWAKSVGKKELRAGFFQMLDAFARGRRHCVTNFVISGSRDKAVVRTYLTVINREDLGRKGSAQLVDTAVQVRGKWLLKSRTIELDPSFGKN